MQAYILVKMNGMNGRPTVGWHWATSGECASNDPARTAFEADGDACELLDTVDGRGTGRVTRVGWTTTDARHLKLGRGRSNPRA